MQKVQVELTDASRMASPCHGGLVSAWQLPQAWTDFVQG